MEIAVVELTRHAQVRMQQRRISQDDIESVVTYGREFGTGGTGAAAKMGGRETL